MKFLIILLLVIVSYAEEHNIFLDAEISVPFYGIAKEIDIVGDENSYDSPTFFLGIALGYSLQLNNRWLLEPSIGFHINSGGSILDIDNMYSSTASIFDYDYYNATLPLMYYNKGTKKGIFFKYIGIPSLEYGGNLKEKIVIKNKHAYAVGAKYYIGNLFFTYEYVFNGKYYYKDNVSYVDIEGSRISIGIRRNF